MKVIHSIKELRQTISDSSGLVGLVPTMGFLHDGHLSLVQAARADNTTVVVSIFVNPTQFGPNEDLESYPRDIERDLNLLEQNGVDIVWLPTAAEMYPENFQTWIDVERVTRPLEGAMRPGHFRGVATVVAKLFNCVTPDNAYFGQKDAQQVEVIWQMVRDLNFPVNLIICPTSREPDGLAKSSRNTYLDPDERQAATVLYRALQAGATVFDQAGATAEDLRTAMEQTIAAEPLARMQYVSCADPQSLQELSGPVSDVLLSMAVYVGRTRLIDNLLLNK